jgi:hypothetical protein
MFGLFVIRPKDYVMTRATQDLGILNVRNAPLARSDAGSQSPRTTPYYGLRVQVDDE